MGTYYPKGVCSRQIDLTICDGKIEEVRFIGGCNGNTQGICKLVTGMDAQKAAELLSGIDCRGRGTSCPDQLSKAILEELANLR